MSSTKKTIPIRNLLKYLNRKLFPIPKPPDISSFNDVCEVELVPHKELQSFYEKTLKKYLPDVGDVTHLEFGVFNGNSLAAAFHAYQKMGLSERKIIAFDSFKGLPSECEHEDGGVWKAGMYRCDRKQAEECLSARNVRLGEIEIVEGWYKEVLNKDLYDRLGLKHAEVVFIDSDTYSSCVAVLDFIKPLIVDRTIVCFDDWKLNNLDLYNLGESKAFHEKIRCDKNIDFLEIRSYNRKSKSFVLSRV